MDSNASEAEFDTQNLSVIGMDGTTLVECGTSLPVVQRSNGEFCLFEIDSESSRTWYAPGLFADYREEGRISAFTQPIPFSKFLSTSEQPLVLFVNDDFLEEAEAQRSNNYQGTRVKWTRIEGESVTTWATCLPEQAANDWLDLSAKQLLQKIDDRLREGDSVMEAEREQLLKWSDLGLCAATETQTRWNLYLRYGAAFMPGERLWQMFDKFVQPEFPKSTWASYENEMCEMRVSMKGQQRSRFSPTLYAISHHKICDVTTKHSSELTFASA